MTVESPLRLHLPCAVALAARHERRQKRDKRGAEGPDLATGLRSEITYREAEPTTNRRLSQICDPVHFGAKRSTLYRQRKALRIVAPTRKTREFPHQALTAYVHADLVSWYLSLSCSERASYFLRSSMEIVVHERENSGGGGGIRTRGPR